MIRQKTGESTPRPIDWITVGYFGWLSTAILLSKQKPPHWLFYIVGHFVLSACIIAAGRRRRRLSRFSALLYDWYPIWGIVFVFLELHPLFHLLVPAWIDEVLLSIDISVFGVFPSEYLERFHGRLLNEVVVFGYFSYYLIPFGISLPLYLRRDRAAFHETTAALFMGTLMCLVLFLLFPAQGPRQYYGHLRTGVLDGYLFVWIQRNLITFGGLNGGAFPSSHCAVAMAALLQAYRHRVNVRWALLVLVPLLSFATVYGWYHYAIDVLAGWLIGFGSVWTAARLRDHTGFDESGSR